MRIKNNLKGVETNVETERRKQKASKKLFVKLLW